jgi:hypothetical protein
MTVKFQAHPGKMAGGVPGRAILTSSDTNAAAQPAAGNQ